MAGHNKGRTTRIFIRIFLVITVIVLVLILVASPLTRYLIQKYDTKYTGREISVGRAFINPLAGYISLHDFRVFEEGSDSVFIYVKKFVANLSLLKLVSGIYQVSSLKIDGPEVKIMQKDTIFNFSDLLQRFSMPEKDTTKPAARMNILNIRLKDGIIRYENDFPLSYEISEINLSSPGMRWDNDSVNADFSLRPGESYMNGNLMVNKEIMDYRVSFDLRNFDFAVAGQYLRKNVKDAFLKANLNIKLTAGGNIKDPMSARAKGRIEVDDFHFGRSETDYLSFEKFVFGVRDADLKEKKLYFDSIYIDKPYVLFQRYDTLDNFRRILIHFTSAEDKTKKDSLNLATKLKDADYSLSYFGIRDGDFRFNDYSIAEKFSMAFSPFNMETDSVSRAEKRVKVEVKSGIKPYGSFNADFAMDPQNDKNFNFNFRLAGLSASSFNPYIITYTSYPLDRGRIEMHGKTTVNNGKIRSLNHFIVIDPRDTKKAKGKDSKWVPLPLILSFIRERGGVIDYEIPVTGDMNDPKFHLGDVISDLLRNILVKPPTTPYRLQVKNVEKEVEKQLNVTWKMRQNRIDRDQEKFIEKIAGFLHDNPEASINVQPVFYEEKEKENILYFEAKKKYFYRSQNREVIALSKDDSMKVEKLSSGDSTFLKYINRFVKNPRFLTLQEKCTAFIGRELVNKRYGQLIEERKKAFMAAFVKEGTEKRVNLLDTKNEVPFNWFSYYRINYKGDVPEKLREAFGKLYEINSEPPRREYFQLRKK